MRALLAAGAFTGTPSAVAAVRALAKGWASTAADELDEAPMSDGGVGLLAAVHAWRGGQTHAVTVAGPLGAPVPAAVLVTGTDEGGPVAYLEAGEAVGTHLAPDDASAAEAALHGTSVGVGQLLVAALELGARRVVLGAGDAATHDGGWGLLRALAGGEGAADPTADAAEVLAGARDRLAGVTLDVAAASGDPLVGLHGAGAALTTRTGLDAAQAQERESTLAPRLDALERAALALAPRALPVAGARTPARPARRTGSGVGGGVGFAASLLGARVHPGGRLVASELGLDARAGRADVVLTGSAVIDAAQIADGGPGIVAAVGHAASAHGVPVVVVGEHIGVGRRESAPIGVSALYEVDDDGAEAALAARAARVARTWSW
ncbi:glycerate kinase [Beutenbergia cavernae DSM 12333]|uniref:Glycerate kinase n=1 Tax=Beutenbergia cavernae (strain ATCC BAA-8 / DSM 12333 / CCUG 43141 / JCM 11478 / NBRC 16432 / NCIMB 13614 / HKI 0122) TaxID=471853 RepID=C5C510_BEUC1|nr:glycerate kinase [Beutenbergia cavernae]ACQ80138.1 glycerate kinase [Beutenbergia cavernae DSM 12333]